MEAPENQGKRTWAEISADADQGNTADNSVGDVVTVTRVTLRPQISSKKWWQGIEDDVSGMVTLRHNLT